MILSILWLVLFLIGGRVSREEGGADWSAVETELCGDDLRRLKTRLKRAAFYFVNDWIEDQRAGVHHAAAKHDAFDVQEINDTRHARADVFSGTLYHHEGKIITFI